MHGIIFHEFRHYINQQNGFGLWNQLLQKAQMEGKMYLPTQMYPDEELEALFIAACQQLKMERDPLLENFGHYIIPQFMRIFGQIVKPEWQLMDVLEHTENVIHRTIRQYDKNATPPQLICEREGRQQVKIYYASGRQMLAFGKGLVLGLSDYYKEAVKLRESTTSKDGREMKMLLVTMV